VSQRGAPGLACVQETRCLEGSNGVATRPQARRLSTSRSARSAHSHHLAFCRRKTRAAVALGQTLLLLLSHVIAGATESHERPGKETRFVHPLDTRGFEGALTPIASSALSRSCVTGLIPEAAFDFGSVRVLFALAETTFSFPLFQRRVV
jgi:hypothetical protein